MLVDAGGVAEEALVAPRGGDEDEEMPQAVPPPPKTQGERIYRLEEEVHESPIKYQRRTRQRTDGASTSAALQHPDP
ncbi:hypothetical protein Tco_1472883 [Tanacetum coccineum]